MAKNEAYEGREQTKLKHRFLTEYLRSWGYKRGSAGRSDSVELYYVDCFAGPWSSGDDELSDTSVAIGLAALNEVAGEWSSRGNKIGVNALFVEKNPKAFERLVEFTERKKGVVKVQRKQGEFGEHVEWITKQLGVDDAFLFVDPKGWKGAAMRFIAPIASAPRRDVLINVMFDFINRAKSIDFDRKAGFEQVRAHLRDFFEADVPPDAGEEDLMRLYRDQLKEKCKLKYALDTAVPKPTSDRTYFRLVLGCRHEAAVALFRATEKKILGEEAGVIRDAAKTREKTERTGQSALDFSASAGPDELYASMNSRDQARAIPLLLGILGGGERRYEELWPGLLEVLHITKPDLNSLVYGAHKEGALQIVGLGPRERKPKEEHRIRSLAPRAKHPPKPETKYVAEDSPEKPEPLLCPKCGKDHHPFCTTVLSPKRKK